MSVLKYVHFRSSRIHTCYKFYYSKNYNKKRMIKQCSFFLLSLLHIIIWVFVLFAFINPTLARINVLYVIPLIFILHTCCPFHILNKAKENMYPNSHEQRFNDIQKQLVLPEWFQILSKQLETRCTFNPLSPQGMLVLGLITSIYSMKLNHVAL